MRLKVLHISESDAGGGAGKSASVLHRGLLARGVGSRMLVGRKLTDDDAVRSIKRNAGWRALDRASGEVMDRLSLQYAFYPSSFAVARDPWFREADVLQLHNLHGSFFSFPALRPLSRRRETVWWMQDMWPVTGHVAYSFDCERWRHGCGSCPYLQEYPALRADRTALLWRMKRSVYSGSRVTIVVSSHWLERVVSESPLLSRFETRVIRNGVDLERFAPRPKEEAARALGIEVDGPTILAFAGERRKGSELVPRILGQLAGDGRPLTVLVAGQRGAWAAPAPVRVVELGTIRDEQKLASAYAAADVFLFPTLADNLPNAMLESLACGTPLVSTEVGGVPDAITHLENGYLAQPGSVEGYAAGVRYVFEDPDRLLRLRENARRRAVERFDERAQAERFGDLYEELLDRREARVA